MKTCKITVLRKVFHEDLAARYENKIEHACDLQEGQVFWSVDGCKPAGMCGRASFRSYMSSPSAAAISTTDG